MTFFEFIKEIAGEYIPNTLDDGTILQGIASINFAYIASYIVVIIVIWWIMHMINNIFFGRRR